ncbi:MAG TPA: hypothetical protein VFK48_15170 [Usitatibacter sp.]|nr:hypothetical protein [Usitatibacter sp.]
MRKLTPAYIVTSVALALASTAALAQLQIQRVGPAPGATTAPSGTTATGSGSTVAAGGCVGTGGSSCTANTTATNSTATSGTVGTTAPSETTAPTGVTASTASPSTATAASSGATASNPATPDNLNSAVADAPFRTTPNTPDAMPTSAALGQSPGQTSFGTAAGNSSTGIDAGSQNLGTVNPSGTNIGNTALVPGVTIGGTTGMGASGTGVNANGERIAGGNGGTVVANTASTPTPIFELTARQGAAREARRRARGEEPRVYGIAPRTERDLTHQMPDDPIIRY